MKRSSMFAVGVLFGLVNVALTPNVVHCEASAFAENTDMILRQIGATRGIAIVLGDPKCELARRLAAKTDLLIYVQVPGDKDVQVASLAADDAGLYGTQIFVGKGPLTHLHLADNLADALIVLGEAGTVPDAEALRVLRPGGRALFGRRTLIKLPPEGVDDWSHPYHGPDNNPQSKDQIARAPYLTQFLAEPRYGPVPQIALASAGRVFKGFGHIAFKVREEPFLNTLVAFNGYNGTMLWKRAISPTYMIHRNTMIATPTTLYVADDKSCKIIDAATGELKDEIIPPVDVAGGTFWKWMALEEGVLYALIGEQEQIDPIVRQKRQAHGWPWNPLSKGYNQPEYPWGFGRNLLAIDPETKSVLWNHHEPEPIDSRALCMNNRRIFAFRFGKFLTCLDAKTGKEVWRKTGKENPGLFQTIGPYLNRQDWRTNWRSTTYLKCSNQALYFAGPQMGKLLALSAEDGRILWQHPYSNFQLIVRDDALYGISGQIDDHVSIKVDPLSGKIMDEIRIGRRACTRPTASIDGIFFRAGGGSTRLDVATGHPQLVSPMRPPCHDGVTIGNGLLYWWPSVCDCNLTLYGITCLSPAGDFDFDQEATESERLETAEDWKKVAKLPQSSADWPTFRANNACNVTTEAVVPKRNRRLWLFSPPTAIRPTAPIAVGRTVFLSGSDGIVRALDGATGKLKWKAYTGGGVRISPSIWNGRALVGSGDGRVYAFEAKTGRLLWRFRAAPTERRIPVYGSLLSTWPAASGVLVEDGTAYVAAGIANYDGTHVYALDAASGEIKWQNNTSGHLDPESRSGVGVQGHLLLHDRKLFLAGGNAVSPAVYDARNGKCLNDISMVKRVQNNNVLSSQSPRGWELYQVANTVLVSGKPYYAHPKYKVYDGSVFSKTLVASSGERDVVWINNARLLCLPRTDKSEHNRFLRAWGKPSIPGAKPLWQCDCRDSLALAVCQNAAVVATASEVTALNLENGKTLWTQPLPCSPVPWGLAVDRNGRVIVTLEDGKVICFG